MANGIYRGRLAADGNGNLLADEGPDAGMPVKYHEGSYVFVQPGEPSHNDTHETNKKDIEGTRDASMVDDESLVNAGNGENMHHFEVQEDDPHYDGVKQGADAQQSKISGHTDAYTGNDEKSE